MAAVAYYSLVVFLCMFGGKFAKDDVSRSPRFGSWWTWGVGIVRFENKYCTGNDGLDGTCYTRRQCRDLAGTAAGLCAGRIGYCCILQKTCGSSSTYNNTYFVNRNFPATVGGGTSCTFVIQQCNPDICQVRIDFVNLVLAPPDSMGFCTSDSLRITGGSSIPRPICGDNSGQHIYLGFNNGNDITISISTSGIGDLARTWNMKVAQIGCDSPTLAPEGCLMYYTGTTGTVSTFNYGRTTSGQYYMNFGGERVPGTRELANLDYGICVKMAPGYCSIEWTETSTGSFAISGNTLTQDEVAPCYNDYVLIPNAVPPNVDDATPDRFCGNSFGTHSTSSKPFVLYVKTDNREQYDDQPLDDVGNLGFSLNYRQIRCNPAVAT